MDVFELREKIAKGENIHIEFKEGVRSNEELAKHIVCFANTDGGQIFIGVADDGIIIGVEDIDEIVRRIDDVAFNRCEPPISVIVETIKADEGTVLVVNVPKGRQRPYRTSKGFYYIRSANRCRQASREELLRLFQATESIFYDEIEIHKATLQDIEIESFKAFVKTYMNIELREEMLKAYMKNLKVISKNVKPTLAGLLFFGNDPQYFLPYAKVIGAYIEGEDIATPPMDKKDFTGRISQILEDSMKFIKLYLEERHTIKGLEPEIHLEIPEVALREALINALAHRDYTVSAPIRIFIFTDKVEFHTPGRLPNTVTVESMKIGGAHVLRNPTIYNFFAKMGLVTEVGSGVFRIIELVRKKLNKEVSLQETKSEFILTIPRKERI
ncbi:MAG: putative DNA binding domain-containing protein [Deltaproteobacteria bacterium]|nr:putative DNA binding domain-containing protein [Deltaproteobacteria bacterium]